MITGLLLFAHGSRDPRWAEPLYRIRDRVAARCPATRVEIAFLEFMQPALGEAIATLAANGAERVTLVPLFIAQGGHLRSELPALVASACEAHPGVIVRTTPPIGDVAELMDAIADWVAREDIRTRDATPDAPVA